MLALLAELEQAQSLGPDLRPPASRESTRGNVKLWVDAESFEGPRSAKRGAGDIGEWKEVRVKREGRVSLGGKGKEGSNEGKEGSNEGKEGCEGMRGSRGKEGSKGKEGGSAPRDC